MSDDESEPFAEAGIGAVFRKPPRVRTIFVRFWGPNERIYAGGRLDPVYRPALAFGIQPNREHRSGAEGGQQRLRRRWPGILASAFERLVDQEPVRADACLDLQVAEPGHLYLSCHVFPLC